MHATQRRLEREFRIRRPTPLQTFVTRYATFVDEPVTISVLMPLEVSSFCSSPSTNLSKPSGNSTGSSGLASSTFETAPGFDANTLGHVDDDFAGPVNIGFTANYSTLTFNQVFVNNNGNVLVLADGYDSTNRSLIMTHDLTLPAGDYNFCRIDFAGHNLSPAPGAQIRIFVDAPASVRCST